MSEDIWIGSKRLRTVLTIGAAGTAIRSAWIIEGSFRQRTELNEFHMVISQVQGGQPGFSPVEDPFMLRGAYENDRTGHSFGRLESALMVIDTPFSGAEPPSHLSVRVLDITAYRGPRNIDAVRQRFDLERPQPSTTRRLANLISVSLEGLYDRPLTLDSRAGAGIAFPKGGAGDATPGRFELFKDRRGYFRWRLRNVDGEIIATSGQGYEKRTQCERDLVWVRGNAIESEVVPLDIPQ